MKNIYNILLVASILVFVAIPVEAEIDHSFYQWQTDRLFAPSDPDIQMEHNGHVFIYSELTDVDVNMALDKQFDRIESMMFVNVILTDDDGNVLIDPVTGELLTENDDC